MFTDLAPSLGEYLLGAVGDGSRQGVELVHERCDVLSANVIDLEPDTISVGKEIFVPEGFIKTYTERVKDPRVEPGRRNNGPTHGLACKDKIEKSAVFICLDKIQN